MSFYQHRILTAAWRSCAVIVVSVLLNTTAIGLAQSSRMAEIEMDIPYVSDGGNEQQLDLYTPDTTNFATIVFVHEGSLTSGDRKDEPYDQMCRTFQRAGIACASINYRLAPACKWPSQPNDVAAAFAWVKRNIAARQGDSTRVFLFGHSSGCLLVSIVAADSQYLAAQGLSQAAVAGVISLGCRLNDVVEVTDAPPKKHEASWVPPGRVAEYLKDDPAFTTIKQRNDAVPASHVNAGLPPTLVLIAEGEQFYPPVLADAAEFVGRALDVGADASLSILKDRKHFTSITSMVTDDDPTVLQVVEFVRSH